MIKKFNEFISEGIMTNTLKRFHTGEQRKEDDKDSIILNRFNKATPKNQRTFLSILVADFFDYTVCEDTPNYDDYVNPMIWTCLTDYLKIYVEDDGNDGEYADWGLPDLLDKYTPEEALKKILSFIKETKEEWKDRFDDDYFYDMMFNFDFKI